MLDHRQQAKLACAAKLITSEQERECFMRSVMGRLSQQPTDADVDTAICFVLSAYGVAIRRSALKLLYLRELENVAAGKSPQARPSAQPPASAGPLLARQKMPSILRLRRRQL